MKIAFFVGQFPSLSQTFILNQITGLLDRGHEVHIYAKKSVAYKEIHNDIIKYNLLDRTFYYEDYDSLKIPGNTVFRSLNAIPFLIRGFYKNPLPLFKSLNFFKYGKEAASLRLLYTSLIFLNRHLDKYDIIHFHFGPNGLLGVLLKDIGVVKGKVITSFYGYDITMYKYKNKYDDLFERGDLILLLIDSWKKEFLNLGCNEQKIVVHKIGIDTNKIPFSCSDKSRGDRVKLITVARLVEKKGVKYAIQAVGEVIKKYPHIDYCIIGDGPLRNGIQNLINELHLNHNVRIVGWKAQEEVKKLMQDSDILLAPSVVGEDGDQEGTPVVLMEAMAHGLPVLSTQHSGIPELVQDGKSGFLVPERDVQALADRLEYLISHQELWPEMGRVGRAYVERHHDINKLNDRLVILYRKLLDGEVLQETD
jgi:colanic acid/amylovoran biosynthesis glycosyltransferase